MEPKHRVTQSCTVIGEIGVVVASGAGLSTAVRAWKAQGLSTSPVSQLLSKRAVMLVMLWQCSGETPVRGNNKETLKFEQYLEEKRLFIFFNLEELNKGFWATLHLRGLVSSFLPEVCAENCTFKNLGFGVHEGVWILAPGFTLSLSLSLPLYARRD